MRGKSKNQPTMLMVMSPGSLVPPNHPLRGIKKLADAALKELDAVFAGMYAEVGRASVPPERLLKALLLMVLYSVRSERQLCEELQYNMLFRWFVDMDMTEPAFDPTTFSKNRERLIENDVSACFLAAIVDQAKAAGLMSGEHFSQRRSGSPSSVSALFEPTHDVTAWQCVHGIEHFSIDGVS